MARRLINNSSPLSLGSGEQVQEQATAHGHMKVGSGDGALVNVTFAPDTSIFASGDLIADMTAIPGAVGIQGGVGILESVTVLDEAAQGAKIFLVFSTAVTSLGTLNSAPNISAANARNIVGIATVLTTDYTTISGDSVATIKGLDMIMQAAAGSTTLYCGIVNATGTPTYTANSLRLKFGFKQF